MFYDLICFVVEVDVDVDGVFRSFICKERLRLLFKLFMGFGYSKFVLGF